MIIHIGALLIRIGFWGPKCYNYKNYKPPPQKKKKVALAILRALILPQPRSFDARHLEALCNPKQGGSRYKGLQEVRVKTPESESSLYGVLLKVSTSSSGFGIPIGSNVVPFRGVPCRILNINRKKEVKWSLCAEA